jgi:curved DNA-binding protein CbpA
MELVPELVLTVNRARDLRELPLTPEDFFLFSRVEALTGSMGPTVAEVVAASGQPPAAARSILERLIELGALTTSQRAQSSSRPRAPATASGAGEELRQRALERRRGMLEAQLRVVKREHEPSASQDAAPSLPAAKAQVAKAQTADKPLHPILESIPPVTETDPRLRSEIPISVDLQRRLLAVRDNLRRIGHFELLGLDPTDDTRALRRAYHVASRDFHPDSFYGKDIGDFRQVLDDLFRRARASFEFLGDASRRRALVEVHEGSVAEQRADVEAEQRQRAEQERAAEEARAQAAADEAREAREAREQRDRERKHRLRDRMNDQRHQQARTHADQAEAELAAGKHGAAATFFRLAHTLDPDRTEYEQKWRESLATARRQRAELCFDRGREALRSGRIDDAARLFTEAADADPNLRNLSEAAGVVAETDPARARELALAALEALQGAPSQGLKIDSKTAARTHHACARAFLAAGQLHSAREQAERAHALAPTEQTRALLNTIKLA